jgi:choline dehydrogenase
MQTNQRGGLRHNTARAYLAAARRRPNLRVMTGATVRRVLFDGRRATGVEFDHRGGRTELRARREVVLCGGSIATPKLLLLSGVGPRAELERHGIGCVADMPGVGANLQEHPGCTLQFDMRVPTMNRIAHSWPRYLLAAADYALRRRGPASSPIAHVVGFLRTDPTLSRPDVQLHFAPFALEHDGRKVGLSRVDRVGVALNVCRPESRGRVSLRSADPQAPPVIAHELLGSRNDVARLIRAARILQRVFATEPLAGACVGRHAPAPEVDSDADWETFLRQHSALMYHPVGTCRMGQDTMAVTDPTLRVREVTGLRIVDASVMPSLPSANTNGPTIMLAERGAALIRGAAD